MTIRPYQQQFSELVQELKHHEQINLLVAEQSSAMDSATREKPEAAALSPQLVDQLARVNGLQLNWENAVQTTTFIEGGIHFLAAGDMIRYRDEAIYFDDRTQAAKRRFYPADLFAEEACCGVFADDERAHLHYYAFSSGEEPFDLRLTPDAYLELAIAVKGYHYWPLLLRLLLEKREDAMIRKFQEDMLLLFPAFRMEQFIRLYQELSESPRQ